MLPNAKRSDDLIQPRSQGSLLLVRDRKTRDQRYKGFFLSSSAFTTLETRAELGRVQFRKDF